MRPQLYTARPLWWECVESCRVLTVSTPPVSEYYINLVVDERSGTSALFHIVVLVSSWWCWGCIFMRRTRFRQVSVLWPRMGESGCRVLVPLWLAFATTLSITSLPHLSLVELLIATVYSWHIIAQWKSIGLQLTVCPVRFHMALPTGVYTTWFGGPPVMVERRKWGAWGEYAALCLGCCLSSIYCWNVQPCKCCCLHEFAFLTWSQGFRSTSYFVECPRCLWCRLRRRGRVVPVRYTTFWWIQCSLEFMGRPLSDWR